MSSDLVNPSFNSFSIDDRSSADYSIFKHLIIRPSILNSRIRARLSPPRTSISFAPDRSSSENYSQFFCGYRIHAGSSFKILSVRATL
jgi:hypothetical protein